MRRSSAERRGFTLIEVAVALAIVALAIGAVAGVLSTGLQGRKVAADADTAVALAEEKLAEPEAGSIRPGHAQGVFAERFEWQRTVSFYDAEGPPGADPLAAAGLRLFRIAVAVGWSDGRRHREVSLSTMRLAPAPAP